MISLGILSWGAHKTLVNTLESYAKFGLLDLIIDKYIFFQDISKEDIRIAEKYGLDWGGASENIGISGGYKELLNSAKEDLFLFLENDWELLRNPIKQLSEAKEMLDFNLADVVRLRDRNNPGHPLWTRQFEGNEMSRPEHLLDSIHWTNPDRFEDVGRWGDWYSTKAKFANYTNNPTIARTNWLKEQVLPRLSGDIEKDIQKWWQEQDFIVVQGEGLFTHYRID